MKKYLRFANLFVLGAGGIGMLLLTWLYAVGTDERGLYPAHHPSWILLNMITVAVAALLWSLIRQAGTNRSYRLNFPVSPIAALGYVTGTIGLLLCGIQYVNDATTLGKIAGSVGILGGICLIPAALARLRGQRSNLPGHILPCFFFALNLFVLGQEFGDEPEMCRYLYRFFASAAMVPACYWLWSFDVNLGKRVRCLFWCLLAAYCNLVAAIGSTLWISHLCVALWMLTALPQLQYLPKLSKQDAAPEPVAEPAPVPAVDLPVEEPAQPVATPAVDLPLEESAQPAATPTEEALPDADAILAELLREYKQQENP